MNNEILAPEVEVMDLESSINTTLVRANVTDQVIASLKNKYGAIRLKHIEDKETYLEIKEARKEVRKVGILTEKLCKKGREDAVAIQRKWLAKEKEILGKIAEVEDPLNSEIEKFENEVERKELEAEKIKDIAFIKRQSVLLKYGAQYNNGSFELNHISYEISLIKEADEEQWNDTILPKYRKVYEEMESVKVAEENKRKEEIAKQKQEREAFEAQQKKFKEEQELFIKQQKELQEQKDAIAREHRIEQERKDAEERQRKQKMVDARNGQLRELGLVYDYAKKLYILGDVEVNPETQIQSLNDYGWGELIELIKPRVKELVKEVSERLAAEGKKKEQEAIERAIADQKFKEQQQQQKKEEELAQANDRTKWLSFIAEVKMLVHSEMKSPMYKSKQAKAKEKIEEILNL